MPPELPSLPPARPAEARALATARQLLATRRDVRRIVGTTVGRAQAAASLAEASSDYDVHAWFLDLFQRQLAADALGDRLPNLTLACQADLPAGPFQLAIMPLSKSGEAELARDQLQAAALALELGGTLVAAVDNPRDQWLREQLGALFSKVTVQTYDDATVYVARKQAELKKVRDFRCGFTYRDGDQLLRAVSRPGVFAHRRLDPGARQLIDATTIESGTRVLDIGCGAGTVAMALAARDPSISVHAVDSSARAIEATLAGVALNGLTNVTAELSCDGNYRGAGEYDLAVANPPYYADNRIAELFVGAADRSLRPGGRLVVVAKHPDWYAATMPEQRDDVEHRPAKNYAIITAVHPCE
jgi:16S rRNA (guanine1207-N2)-methyltransferase